MFQLPALDEARRIAVLGPTGGIRQHVVDLVSGQHAAIPQRLQQRGHERGLCGGAGRGGRLFQVTAQLNGRQDGLASGFIGDHPTTRSDCKDLRPFFQLRDDRGPLMP
jgi:hypothetical protein